jgi:hypothetical protein
MRRAFAPALGVLVAAAMLPAATAAGQGSDVVAGVVSVELAGVALDGSGDAIGSSATVPVEIRRERRGERLVVTVTPSG